MVRSVNQSFSLLALQILRAKLANVRESVVSAFVKSREQDEVLGGLQRKGNNSTCSRLCVSFKEEPRALRSADAQ